MEMEIRNEHDLNAVKEQNLEQLASQKRLSDMKFIKDMNSDVSVVNMMLVSREIV